MFFDGSPIFVECTINALLEKKNNNFFVLSMEILCRSSQWDLLDFAEIRKIIPAARLIELDRCENPIWRLLIAI